MSLCDKLWEKKKTSWFWGLIWRIFGCRTPVVQVLTCLGTRKIANDWCPDTELRSYNRGTEPTEVCDQHKEPEKVHRLVCKASGMVPLPTCFFTEMREFEKGTEPQQNCGIHKLPKFRDQIKNFEGDFLGIFVDTYLPGAWDPASRPFMDDQVFEVLKGLRFHGGKSLSCFALLSSGQQGHDHCNYLLPWVIKKNLLGQKEVDFGHFEPRWWGVFERFNRLLKMLDIEPKWQAFMAGAYNKWPFTHNKQGIKELWSDEARIVQSKFVIQILLTLKKIWGENYKPYIKFMNEPRLMAVFPGDKKASLHGGDHIIAEWHKDIWESIQHLTSLDRLIVDVSAREAAFNQLIRFSPGGEFCEKCKRQGIVFEWDNKKEYDRLLIHEKHGLTCPEALEGITLGVNWFSLAGLIRSAWYLVKVSEDGGCWLYAKGYRLFDYKVQFGTAEQLYEMITIAIKACKRSKRKKEILFGIWPAEVFVKIPGGIRQIYKVESINWKRFEMVEKAFDENL